MAGVSEGAGVAIEITINGERRRLTVEPWVTLLDLCREELGLTGSKKGCARRTEAIGSCHG